MPETPLPVYRPMTAADIDATGYIRKAALEDLARRENRTHRPWMPRRFPHFEHLLRTDGDCAWVASVSGTVVGYAMGFVRGDIWFLAQLFVQPELHSTGIGQEVLRRSQDAGRARGARIVSVCSSTSPVAQALYMRHGMFATAIGYHLAGPVDGLVALPAPAGNEKLVVDCAGWQDRIAEMDGRVWGAERRIDHELYLSAGYEHHAFALNRDGVLAGYGYAAESGHIGPLAAGQPEDQLGLLRTAGDWLRDREVGDAWAFVISANSTAIAALLEHGWRIDGWTFFLTSAPFGQFDRYIPSGGLLL